MPIEERGIAHDLNNTLVALLASTDLLLESTAGDDPRRADLQELNDAALRAVRLTRFLLGADGGASAASVELGDVVAGLAPMLRRLAGLGLPLRIHRDGPAPACIDTGRLEQIIVNLVVNARDASRAGATITIVTEVVELPDALGGDVGHVPAGRWARLTVSDAGSGIDAAIAGRIFDPLFTTKAASGGCGLGLANVQRIVHEHGGHVVVHTRPGAGTTFAIHLPCADDAPATGAAARR